MATARRWRQSTAGLQIGGSSSQGLGIGSSRRLFGGGNSAHASSTPLCPLPACERVAQSWAMLSSDLEAAGVDFLTRIFLDVPGILSKFPFASESLSPEEMEELARDADKMKKYVSESRMVKAHARLFMREVGRCVSGLTDVPTLVPRLRSLGRLHGAMGVQPFHYDVFFRHLLDTVKDRLGVAWDYETADAWCTVHAAIGAVMKTPFDAVVDAEVLGRWSLAMAVASAYLCVTTPLRLAGLLHFESSQWAKHMLNLLEMASATTFLLELLGTTILHRVKISDVRESKLYASRGRTKKEPWTQGIKSFVVLGLRSLGLHEVVTWPRLSLLVLCSFPLQWAGEFGFCVDFLGECNDTFVDVASTLTASQSPHRGWVPDGGTYGFLYGAKSTPFQADDTVSEIDVPIVGVHWTRALGLLRLASLIRVVYTNRCIENEYTIYRHADVKHRTTVRIFRLILALSYTSHLMACLWCLVARIELGPEGTTKPSSFFPDPSILSGEGSLLNSYVRSVHFAWVNLAGIGNHESVPESTLECIFTLVVNVTGATLYAITTGQVMAILEETTFRENQISEEAATLTDFMHDVGASAAAQDRIMQGYLLRNVVGNGEDLEGANAGASDSGPFAVGPGLNASAPSFPDESANRLPRHLREELWVISLADALSRRDRLFRRCSDEFVSALASALRGNVTLLPGDYFVRQGEATPSQPYVIEQGKMEVMIDGRTARTLERGDMLGFYWSTVTEKDKETPSLVAVNEGSPTASKASHSHGTFSPLLLSEKITGASVRATEHCRLATGLSSAIEVQGLKRRFSSDFAEIEEVLHQAGQSTKKLRAAMTAVRALKKTENGH